MTLLLQSLTALRRNQARRDISAFDALIGTPGDLTAGVVLPANGELELVTDAVLAETTLMVECGEREIGMPTGAAGVFHVIGWFERARTIQLHADAVGAVQLYVRDDIGNRYMIAEA